MNKARTIYRWNSRPSSNDEIWNSCKSVVSNNYKKKNPNREERMWKEKTWSINKEGTINKGIPKACSYSSTQYRATVSLLPEEID